MAENRWLDRPRDVRARRFVYLVHLWSGVAIALYLLLMGVTGSALVFRDELEHGLEKAWPSVEPGATASADLEAVADRVRQAYPDRQLAALVSTIPPNHRTIRAYLRKGEDYLAIDVHPATGKILGEAHGSGFLRWLRDLHFNLLSGRAGRVVNGAGAVCLLAMSLTGALIWWPGRQNWRRSMTVDFSRGWKRVTWDLHGATGFWTFPLLAIWAISGIYFAWPAGFMAMVNRISPLSFQAPPPPDTAVKTAAQPRLNDLLRRAREGSPRSRLLSVSFPANDRGHIRVFMAREEPMSYGTADYHYFDPFTGAHAGVWRRGINRSAGDWVMAWLGPLHFGTFGGEGWAGVAVKAGWMVLGLSPAVLGVSGLLMYWNRSLSKKIQPAKGYTGSLRPHANDRPRGTRQVPTH